VGSRSKTNKAYIAGFLDGDGSLMLQVKKRSDTKRGVRFMATICLYQDTRHEKPLYWMREQLGIGYISHRSDGISELRINGFEKVRTILTELKPFIRFKEKQSEYFRKFSCLFGIRFFDGFPQLTAQLLFFFPIKAGKQLPQSD